MLEHADDLYFPLEDKGLPRATPASVTLPHVLAVLALAIIVLSWATTAQAQPPTLAPGVKSSDAIGHVGPPHQLHYRHLADGRLLWQYAEGWQIMRSWRQSDRLSRPFYTWEVFHDGKSVAVARSRREAMKVVARRGMTGD